MNNNILWTATLGIFASLNLYLNIFENYNIRYLNIYNGGTEFIPIQNNDFYSLCNEIQFQCKSNNSYDIEFVESIIDYRVQDELFFMDTSCQDYPIYQKINTKINANSYAYFQHNLLPDSLWHFQIQHQKGDFPLYLRLMDETNFNLWKLNLPFEEETKPIKIFPHNNQYIPLKIQHEDISYKKRNMVVVIDYQYYNLFNKLFNQKIPYVDIYINYIVKPKKICDNSYKKQTITCKNQKTPWLSFPENGQGIIIRPEQKLSFVDKYFCR